VVEGPITQSDNEEDPKGPGMMGLIRELMRPYRGSLAMILVAMLVQSTMTLAAPWPLKIIIDNVVVGRKLDPWLAGLLKPLLAHGHRSHLAEIAALAVILIAILNAAASYLANYLTESVGQWVANDLRMRT
jgi:ABC-type multidrug transport system fused ATPase/permease subunit